MGGMVALKRPRFSLLTLFLATALACASFALWQAFAQDRLLRRDVAGLHILVRAIDVDDPRAAYLRQLSHWGSPRYRVYLPSNREFKLHVGQGPARTGLLPTAPGYPHPSGEFTIIVKVKQRGDQTYLTVISASDAPPISRSIPLERSVAFPMMDWTGSQQKLDPDKPFVLLDVTTPNEGNGGSLAVYFTSSNDL